MRPLRLALVALSAAADAAAPPGIVVHEVSGGSTDATSLWSTFAMGHSSRFAKSYAISDKEGFSKLAWAIGDYATQGSLIAEKVLALGPQSNIAMVRGWLAKVPQNTDGKCWGTESGELHQAGQGAFESSAEVILIARHYAAHTGDAGAFSAISDHLTCVSAAPGGPLSLIGSHSGLDNSICMTAPSSLSARHELLYDEYLTAPLNQTIPGGTLVRSHGKALFQHVNVTAGESVSDFALCLGSDAPAAEQSPLLVIVAAVGASGGTTIVSSTRVASVSNGWVRVSVSAPLAPGHYLVSVVIDPQSKRGGSPPYWVTDARSITPGGGAHFTYFEWPAAAQVPPAMSLADRLGAALGWQLEQMGWTQNTGVDALDVFAITEPQFRGSNDAGVNAASSYYDQHRVGFVSSYINLRVLESLLAYQELQTAGLVRTTCDSSSSSSTAACVTPAQLSTAIARLRSAIATRFGLPSGGLVSWFGCTCTNATSTTCNVTDAHPGSSNPCIQQWDIEFLPAQALAVKLGVPVANATAELSRMRESGRKLPGLFRTNLIGFEDVSPMLWVAADRWAHKSPAGFAVREANQTGDWMLFDATVGPADGNGQWGRHQQNGGALLGTTGFIFETGAGPAFNNSPVVNASAPFFPRASPYAELYKDWRNMVISIGNVSTQLAANDVSQPLLRFERELLRLPMVAKDLPQLLCAAARGPGSLTNKDSWGDVWCDYYASIHLDLPEGGLLLYSFVKSLLGLYVTAIGELYVAGGAHALPIPGSVTVSPLPPAFPPEVDSIVVSGLSVGAARGVTLSCSVDRSAGTSFSCSTAL